MLFAAIATDANFMLFSGEQHAIGELMLSWQNVNGIRVPSVERYATFAGRFRNEDAFRAWFEPIEEGMQQTSDGQVRRRLTLVQHRLVELMDLLDPENHIYKKRTKVALPPESQRTESKLVGG